MRAEKRGPAAAARSAPSVSSLMYPTTLGFWVGSGAGYPAPYSFKFLFILLFCFYFAPRPGGAERFRAPGPILVF